MYQKKLRELFQKSKRKAEQALDEGRTTEAASHYERCGDILKEQAKNSRPSTRDKKEELAEEYYGLRDELLGESGEKRTGGEAEEFEADSERFLQETGVTWSDVAGLRTTSRS